MEDKVRLGQNKEDDGHDMNKGGMIVNDHVVYSNSHERTQGSHLLHR